MMKLRGILLAALLVAGLPAAVALAEDRGDVILAPVLRANVSVVGDVVRIGDVVDNAGSSARIAIYRAPDLGTTGSLSTEQVLAVLRAHQVIGVDTGNIHQISVTRLARTIEGKEIEQQVAHALEHRGGLGDAAALTLTFDRDLQDLRLDAANSGEMQATSARFDPRSGRFDVAFEIGNAANADPVKLRFTGTAVETIEAAVLTRDVEHNEVLKASDVTVERRPKASVGADAAARERAVGMQMRRPQRAGTALRIADLAKPDLVVRDQSVTLTYQAAGLYLTIRGKALETGTEGDVVNVLNSTSNRTVSGVVTGRGQVTISVAMPAVAADPEVTSSIGSTAPAAAVSVANKSPLSVSPKAE